jgi:hypothetical protein
MSSLGPTRPASAAITRDAGRILSVDSFDEDSFEQHEGDLVSGVVGGMAGGGGQSTANILGGGGGIVPGGGAGIAAPGGVDGGGLSLAYNRPTHFTSPQLSRFISYYH